MVLLIRDIFIGIIVVTLISAIGVVMLYHADSIDDDVIKASDTSVNLAVFDKTFGNFSEINKLNQTISGLLSDETDWSGTDAWNALIKRTWQVMKSLPKMMLSFFGGMTKMFGIPAIIPYVIIIILGLIIVFNIISGIMQKEI